MFEAVVIGF